VPAAWGTAERQRHCPLSHGKAHGTEVRLQCDATVPDSRSEAEGYADVGIASVRPTADLCRQERAATLVQRLPALERAA
jgi:hypothetical protein